jgi:MarR family transcriptional regulator, organic hydroperoxide resistance regulator
LRKQEQAAALLWGLDGQTVGELGERLLRESNTLTPLLKWLENLGHIGRRRDPNEKAWCGCI